MIYSRILLVACLLISCFAIACEGPEGPVGPEGPQGAEGPQGPQGPEGNANVVADTVTLVDGDWEDGRFFFQTSSNSSLSRSARVATLEVPEITEEIYDLGMVHVYFKTLSGFGGQPNLWTPLPYQILAFGGEFYYNFNFAYDIEELKLYYYYTPNSSETSPPPVRDATIPAYTFKYVITAPALTQSMVSDGVNWENHDEVMEYIEKHFDVADQDSDLR